MADSVDIAPSVSWEVSDVDAVVSRCVTWADASCCGVLEDLVTVAYFLLEEMPRVYKKNCGEAV
ncbi:hypothetical protein Hanom_Chr02g00112031 [Helianthus anomalus]